MMWRAAFVVFALLCASPVHAHPHVWVDIKVRVLFDAQGRVSALHETWLFDDYYSAFALTGADKDGDGKPDQNLLDEVLAENLKNLAEYNYFTRVMSGETVVATGTARDAASRVQDKRLEMSFLLPLDTPVSANDLPLRYAVYDPTYYIEMVHAEAPDAVTLADAPKGCEFQLKQPDPDPEQVVLAASLDKTQTAGNGLGGYFAEEVYLTCG